MVSKAFSLAPNRGKREKREGTGLSGGSRSKRIASPAASRPKWVVPLGSFRTFHAKDASAMLPVHRAWPNSFAGPRLRPAQRGTGVSHPRPRERDGTGSYNLPGKIYKPALSGRRCNAKSVRKKRGLSPPIKGTIPVLFGTAIARRFYPEGVTAQSPGSRKRTLGLLATWRFLPRRGWINGTLPR
jgi:hypothetical protein